MRNILFDIIRDFDIYLFWHWTDFHQHIPHQGTQPKTQLLFHFPEIKLQFPRQLDLKKSFIGKTVYIMYTNFRSNLEQIISLNHMNILSDKKRQTLVYLI